MQPLPDGFHLRQDRNSLIVARTDLLAGVDDLRLTERGAIRRLMASGERGESGRGATAIVRWPGGGPSLVVRRHLHGGLLGRWLGDRFLRPTRPISELILTADLASKGVPVLAPALAIGERRMGTWRLAYATVEAPDSVDALRWLEAAPPRSRVNRAATALGLAVRQFHDAGGFHADLHIKNLMLEPVDDRFRAVVIDLDRARIVLGMTPEERMSQLMRIFRSLVKRDLVEAVGAQGCARFLTAYCGDDRALRRAMWRRVDAELRNIAIHRLAYRSPAAPTARTATGA